MKTATYTMCDIDGDALAKAIKSRGLSRIEMSERLGYSSAYLRNVVTRGRIMTKLIEEHREQYNAAQKAEYERIDRIARDEGALESW